MLVKTASAKKDPQGLKESHEICRETPGSRANQSNYEGPVPDLCETLARTGNTHDDQDKRKIESNCKRIKPDKHHSYPSLHDLHFHIRVLYALTACLVFLLVSSAIICYLQITSLKREIGQKATASQLMRYQFSRRRINPNLNVYQSSDGQFAELRFEPLGPIRHRRDADSSNDNGEGHGKDWAWVDSYSRVKRANNGMVRAIKSYCKEAQNYCAAKGPPGEPGQKGDQGEKGASGMSAPLNMSNLSSGRGLPGPPGPKGDRGERGYRGHSGPRGNKGERGEMGIRGEQGRQGDQGLLGFPGVKGPRGPAGSPGHKGVRGTAGSVGSPGTKGNPGSPALPGRKGETGPMGPTGLRGYPGDKGEPGYCPKACGGRTVDSPTVVTTMTTPVTFPPRNKECALKMIGKPVLKMDTYRAVGVWMKDVNPIATTRGKFWLTFGTNGSYIFEYNGWSDVKRNNSRRFFNLHATPFYGTGHIVSKGYLYYHQAFTPFIVRYNLTLGQSVNVKEVANIVYKPKSSLSSRGYLYDSASSFVNFYADSNGLWLVYRHDTTNKMVVTLLDPDNLAFISSLQLDVEAGSKGNAIIICGKLYTVKSSKDKRSSIDKVYDLWASGSSKNVNYKFLNPFGTTYMMSYEYRTKLIRTWNQGKLLRIPILL